MASGNAIAKTKAAIDNGNLLLAYDLAVSAINDGDASVELRHLMVLALARMGNGEQALALFREFGLDQSPDAHHRSIAARIMKDSALAISDIEERQFALLGAFEAYREIYDESERCLSRDQRGDAGLFGGKG